MCIRDSTRAKARSEVEPEDLEQSDVASVTTTTIASSIPVGLQVESTGEFESMATEIVGPVATHPQLPPEGGHPSAGSANSPLVGVSTLGYPSGPADPLDSAMASVTDTLTTAEATAISTTASQPASSRQPPTALTRRLPPFKVLQWRPAWLTRPRAVVVDRRVLLYRRVYCRRHTASNSRSLFHFV